MRRSGEKLARNGHPCELREALPPVRKHCGPKLYCPALFFPREGRSLGRSGSKLLENGCREASKRGSVGRPGVPDQKTNIFLLHLARPGAARRVSQSELGTDRVRNAKSVREGRSVGDVDPTFNFAPPFNFAALRAVRLRLYVARSRGGGRGGRSELGIDRVRNAKIVKKGRSVEDVAPTFLTSHPLSRLF